MDLVENVRPWTQAIVLFLLSLVWVSFQWEAVRGLVTEGPAVVDTVYEATYLLLLFATLAALAHEVWQTASD